MSIPLNHHYVSQCQIKNFFNKEENAIYLYDKQRDNFYSKTTTKSIFSERGLNSRLAENDTIDHETIEQDIKTSFEDSFRKHTEIITKGIVSKTVGLNFKNSLDEVAKLAIIGDFRTPEYKQKTDQLFGKAFKEIANHATPQLKKALEKFFIDREKTKYSNAMNYSEMANEIFKNMGSVNHKIVWIQSNDCFVLPDCTSVVKRERINKHFNPDAKEIAVVGIPLTSKVFVLTTSNKLKPDSDGLMPIETNNHDYVFQINGTLTANSKKAIACENKNYLDTFVRWFKNASTKL
jgi:hypothetical protein